MAFPHNKETYENIEKISGKFIKDIYNELALDWEEPEDDSESDSEIDYEKEFIKDLKDEIEHFQLYCRMQIASIEKGLNCPTIPGNKLGR